MKLTMIIIGAFLLILIIYFRKDAMKFSEEILLPDQNPELVSYLQGDWVANEDAKFVSRIERDSIIQIYNDTIRSTESLLYLFTGAASKYFTKDSSFDFLLHGELSKTNYEFRLKEVNKNLSNITWDTLVFVSKSRLKMISRGRTISFNRIKKFKEKYP